jgi:glutathione S-transferase
MKASPLVLDNYFRSSSAYRVRIALNLKGLSYDYVPVHLNRNGGDSSRNISMHATRSTWCRCWPMVALT